MNRFNLAFYDRYDIDWGILSQVDIFRYDANFICKLIDGYDWVTVPNCTNWTIILKS